MKQPLSKDRISHVVEKWYMQEPLYFALWTCHELHMNSHILTLRSGAGKIDYNPEFIQTLDDKTLEQVLGFEVMRLLLKHPYQRRQPQAELTYQASTITVQEYLKTPLPIADAKQTFQTQQYNYLHFEAYYQLLVDMNSTPLSSGEGSNDNSSPLSGEGEDDYESFVDQQKAMSLKDEQPPKKATPLECYSDKATAAENTETWETNEYHRHKINEKIEWAAQNQQWGSLSGDLQQSLLASLKPKLNYRELLKHFRASILSSHRCLTRMKPSRRYGFSYMGCRRDFNTCLLVAVDVSGSINHHDIQCAFSVINQLFKYGIEVIDVIQFDTQIKGEAIQLTKARSKIDIKGRGGTDFQAPLDYIDEHRHYDGLIIFTDGYAPSPSLPKNCKTTLFWLFNHQQNYQATKDNLQHLGKAGFVLE